MTTHKAITRENSDYARELTKDARDRSHPLIRPRDAATLMIIDRSGKEPRVLMGKRHASHTFMPRKFVFPGGRLDPADRRMSVAGALPDAITEKLLARVASPSPQKARALALAAVREAFEETGLLLGTKSHGPPQNAPPGAWAQFAALGVFPDLEHLHFIARAVTPPRRPKRFDTRFFTIDASHIAHRVEGVVGPDTELVELVWQKIGEADSLDIPSVQHMVLQDLAARVAAGMAHHLPVPFYREIGRRWRRELL